MLYLYNICLYYLKLTVLLAFLPFKSNLKTKINVLSIDK